MDRVLARTFVIKDQYCARHEKETEVWSAIRKPKTTNEFKTQRWTVRHIPVWSNDEYEQRIMSKENWRGRNFGTIWVNITSEAMEAFWRSKSNDMLIALGSWFIPAAARRDEKRRYNLRWHNWQKRLQMTKVLERSLSRNKKMDTSTESRGQNYTGPDAASSITY